MKYFFSRNQKKIIFNFGERSINFITINSSVHLDTLAKLAEGINHMLAYFEHTDYARYEKLALHIFKTHSDICVDKKEKLTPTLYQENQLPLIIQYCQLDMFLIESICMYVKENSIHKIDESAASTTITIKNIHADVLSCIVVAIKFSYIYSALLRSGLSFEQTLDHFLDPLISNIVTAAADIFDIDDPEVSDSNDMFSYIDNFIYQLAARIWDENTENSFKRKFEEFGRDTTYFSDKYKKIIVGSFKKYVPQAIDVETACKYKEYSKDILATLYFTTEKDYKDFKFVSTNLTSYMHITLKKLVVNQDSRITLPEINVPDFIIDGSEERTNRKDIAFYEDKLRHLFDLKKGTSVELFKSICNEPIECDQSLSFVKNLKISKQHTFNQFILHKCLFALTGESRVYSEILGIYGKFLLRLFYVQAINSPVFDFLKYNSQNGQRHKLDIMFMNPSNAFSYGEEDIRMFLAQYNLNNINPKAFNSVLRIYSDEHTQLYLEKEEWLDLFSFMSSPARLRNLLMPNTYSAQDDVPIQKKPSNLIKSYLQKIVPKRDEVS